MILFKIDIKYQPEELKLIYLENWDLVFHVIGWVQWCQHFMFCTVKYMFTTGGNVMEDCLHEWLRIDVKFRTNNNDKAGGIMLCCSIMVHRYVKPSYLGDNNNQRGNHFCRRVQGSSWLSPSSPVHIHWHQASPVGSQSKRGPKQASWPRLSATETSDASTSVCECALSLREMWSKPSRCIILTW